MLGASLHPICLLAGVLEWGESWLVTDMQRQEQSGMQQEMGFPQDNVGRAVQARAFAARAVAFSLGGAFPCRAAAIVARELLPPR